MVYQTKKLGQYYVEECKFTSTLGALNNLLTTYRTV